MAAQSTFSSQAPRLESKVVVSMMFRDTTVIGRICNGCNTFIKQSKKAGYTNLISHLSLKDSGYEDVVRRCIQEKRSVSMDMFVDRHALTTYQWLNLIVHKNFVSFGISTEVVSDTPTKTRRTPAEVKAAIVA